MQAPSGLGDARLSETDAPVGKLEEPVYSAGLRMSRDTEPHINRSCGRLEPGSTIPGRRECVRPVRQVAGVAQKLEHFAARGSDLNALDIEHAHGRLLERRDALSGPFDNCATSTVNGH